jgi:hypothetical protein
MSQLATNHMWHLVSMFWNGSWTYKIRARRDSPTPHLTCIWKGAHLLVSHYEGTGGCVRRFKNLPFFFQNIKGIKYWKAISLLVSCECETWSLNLELFENEVGLVVHIRQEKWGVCVWGGGEKKLYNEKCHTLYSSKKIFLRHQMKQNALDK